MFALKKLIQYYQIFCNLSLDVVGGVFCSAYALTYTFKLNAPIVWYLALPLGTWLIYLTDHLVDVKRTHQDFPTLRHQFIKLHVKRIIALSVLIAVAIVSITLIYWNTALVMCGAMMLLVILLHLAITRTNPQGKNLFNNKELSVAAIYAACIFIYPLYLSMQTNMWLMVAFFLLFLLITYQNLLLCSIIEFDIDEQMNNTSFIRTIGLKQGKVVWWTLTSLALLLVLVLHFYIKFPHINLLRCYELIILGNCLIYLNAPQLQKHLLYRKLAELLFWLPIVSILF